MAHEVEMIDGIAQMAYAGDVPWHGLGTEVSNDLTPQQMMQKAGLDWTVEKYDAVINVPHASGATQTINWCCIH